MYHIVITKISTRLYLRRIILVYASMLETLHILPVNTCVGGNILMAFAKSLLICYRLKEIEECSWEYVCISRYTFPREV